LRTSDLPQTGKKFTFPINCSLWDSDRACHDGQGTFRILYISQDLLSEALRFLPLLVSAKASLAAEVLFLRKQLAFYQERKIKPRRFDDSARLSMLVLAKLFDWKNALVNVKPETFISWHKQAFQMFWRWKSRGEGRGCRRTFAD